MPAESGESGMIQPARAACTQIVRFSYSGDKELPPSKIADPNSRETVPAQPVDATPSNELIRPYFL